MFYYTVHLCSIESNSIASEETMKLLMAPLEHYDNTLCVLQLEYYPKVLQLFDYHGRKQLGVHLATTIVEKCTYITTPNTVSDDYEEFDSRSWLN